MSFCNIFVGCETGLIKGINIEKNNWTNLTSVKEVSRENEILALTWSDVSQSKFYVGMRSNVIHCYDIGQHRLTENCTLQEKDSSIVSLQATEGQLITGLSNGEVAVWSNKHIMRQTNVGTDLCKLRCSKQKPNIMATGGKENQLKIWDINALEKPLFTAKNVKNNYLSLRIPVWITDIGFIGDSDKVVTSTRHHQVRVYDPKSSMRRPVIDMSHGDHPLTALSITPCNNQVVVGSSQGSIAMMDLRKGGLVQCFKGTSGSILDVACHSSKPVFATCGLDRFLRLYHIHTKEVVHKFYMKSRLNCLLFADQWEVNVKQETQEDENLDDIWEQIPAVSRKRKQDSNTISTKKPAKKKVKVKKKGD